MSLAEIRKLRKKIRQLECLEQLDRVLSQEEVLKVTVCNHHTYGCRQVLSLRPVKGQVASGFFFVVGHGVEVRTVH